MYALDTDTRYDPGDATEPYRIAHAVMDLRHENRRTKLHMGLARSGMIPVGVYFDYDGLVDVDMAYDFARDIPLVGGRLARAYDPVIRAWGRRARKADLLCHWVYNVHGQSDESTTKIGC